VPDIIDNAYAVVDYQGGARAMLDLCMFAEGSRHEVEISATGERGKVEAFEPDDEVVICYRDGRPPQRIRFEIETELRQAGSHHGSTYYEHLAFLAAIRGGNPSAVNARDGAMAVAVGAAAERSIRLARPVELRELGF
ncbi:MAG TPA: Gfo/Idh/MocA family oxidoreductase, partial [Terriglobales bacterium]|nr:Gfo/Idh/MocA family oxidoreductase [Terriglobales bacterium]